LQRKQFEAQLQAVEIGKMLFGKKKKTNWVSPSAMLAQQGMKL
jgi:hypothetical protein